MRQINRRKPNLIMYMQGLHKNMRPTGEVRQLKFVCHPELRRGYWSGTSKGRRTIHREMKRANVW